MKKKQSPKLRKNFQASRKRVTKKEKKVKRRNKRILTGAIIFSGMFLIIYTLFIGRGKFDDQLRTSTITSEIKSLEKQISPIRKCIKVDSWTPQESEVCKYILFDQKNTACDRFDNAPKERLGIGTKNCCQGDFKNSVICPGDDILDENIMIDSYLVEDRESCSGGRLCEYYCDNGYHFKDEEENVFCEKDCPEKILAKTVCSEVCGGGTRQVTKMTKFCEKINFQEACNTQPCGSGWKEVGNY